jgi:copper resistance protein D
LLDPLVFARLVHFAATMSVAGVVFFFAFVALPAFRDAKIEGGGLARVHAQFAAISWIALALTLVSGAAWLIFQAAQIADLPPAQALSEGAAWTILSDTDFGHAWTIRLAFACLLALSLPRQRGPGVRKARPRLTAPRRPRSRR